MGTLDAPCTRGVAMRKIALMLLAVLALSCSSYRAEEWHRRGMAAYEAHDWKAMEHAFGEAVKADPGSARNHTNHGMALARLHLLAPAVEEFRTALTLDPTYKNAQVGLERARRDALSDQEDAMASALQEFNSN